MCSCYTGSVMYMKPAGEASIIIHGMVGGGGAGIMGRERVGKNLSFVTPK